MGREAMGAPATHLVTELPLPAPWTTDDNGACCIVREANGLVVAYVHCEEEPGRCTAANLMTKDEARRIAANIAKLPGLLGRPARK
jgi:hypothetical protein